MNSVLAKKTSVAEVSECLLLKSHFEIIVEAAALVLFVSLVLLRSSPPHQTCLLVKSQWVLDSLSMASELKVSAVSRDKQSTVTSPPWMRYQLCLRGVVPSNLSWKPVLELSFMPIRTSSRAHWAECFPAEGQTDGSKVKAKGTNTGNAFF